MSSFVLFSILRNLFYLIVFTDQKVVKTVLLLIPSYRLAFFRFRLDHMKWQENRTFRNIEGRLY